MGNLRNIRKGLSKPKCRMEPVKRSRGKVSKKNHKFPEPKMSEILLKYADPLMTLFQREDFDDRLFQLAVLCWNLSYLPDDVAEDVLGKNLFSNIENVKDRQVSQEICMALIEARKLYYPGICRFVIDYEIVDDGPPGHDTRLLVSSAPVKEKSIHELFHKDENRFESLDED